MSEMSDKKECIKGKAGYVYVFANPCIRGWVKIGIAGDWRKRLKNYQQYVPEDYYPVATLKTANCRAVEHYIHKVLGKFLSKKKEFLQLTPDDAANHLKEIAELMKELAGFERHDRGATKSDEAFRGIIFHAAKKGSDIRMKVRNLDCFTILKGSKLMPMGEAMKTGSKPYAVSLRDTRTRLESDPNTVKDGTLIRDFDFVSPSRALAVMLGVSAMQGPQYWIDKDGRPLADYLPKKKG